MEKEMVKTKKELMEMLNNAINYYFYEERNPFEEVRMVNYLSNGIKKLNDLNVSDETLVKMYDVDNKLNFMIED